MICNIETVHLPESQIFSVVMYTRKEVILTSDDCHIYKIPLSDVTYGNHYTRIHPEIMSLSDVSNFEKLMRDINVTDKIVLRMALHRISSGQDFDRLKELYHAIMIIRNYKVSDFERMVTIKQPRLERRIDNNNSKTFDFVRCYVNITGDREDAKNYIKNHSKEILREVYYKIENCNQFKKYGVPIAFLKISSVTLRCDSSVEYLFELKEFSGGRNEKV